MDPTGTFCSTSNSANNPQSSNVQLEDENLAAAAPPDHSKQFMSDSPPPYPGDQQAYPQQASYPQQGLEYPQQQGPYPTQQQPQAGYPQQQYPPTAYPVQQPGYPPQQQGYVQQQTAYPLSSDAPPSYYHPQMQPGPAQQQQAHTNTIVVQQPQVVHQTRVPGNDNSDDSLSALACTLCTLFLLLGCWWSLVCTVPAIIFAHKARTAKARRDEESAKLNSNLSFCCTVSSAIFLVVFPVVVFTAIFAR